MPRWLAICLAIAWQGGDYCIDMLIAFPGTSKPEEFTLPVFSLLCGGEVCMLTLMHSSGLHA